MIGKYEVANFKAIGEAAKFELRPITLVFGPNSAGKSSLLHSFLLLKHIVEGGTPDVHRMSTGGDVVDLGGRHQYAHRGRATVETSWSFEEDHYTAHFTESGLPVVYGLTTTVYVKSSSPSDTHARPIARVDSNGESQSFTRGMRLLGEGKEFLQYENGSLELRPHHLTKEMVEELFRGMTTGVSRTPAVSRSDDLLAILGFILSERILQPFGQGDLRRRSRTPYLLMALLNAHRVSDDLRDFLHGAYEFHVVVHNMPLDQFNDLLGELLFPGGDDPIEAYNDAEYVSELEQDFTATIRWGDESYFAADPYGRGDDDLEWAEDADDPDLDDETEEYDDDSIAAFFDNGDGLLGALDDPILGEQERWATVDPLGTLGHEEWVVHGVLKALRDKSLHGVLNKFVELADSLMIQALDPAFRVTHLGPLRGFPEPGGRTGLGETVLDSLGAADWRAITTDRELRDTINEWLGPTHLGSHLQVTVKRLFREDTLSSALETIASRGGREMRELIESLPADSVTTVLHDALRGMEVSVRNVGVGISQVLPVLVRALSPNIPDTLNLIEQPELHLHPALQAEIADVFIAGGRGPGYGHAGVWTNWIKSFLIETHSEHLVLRLLRRIRETSEKRAPEGLELLPDEVAIYYADVTESGTQFIRMEISEEGDFRTPWPNGFFPERLNELL